MLGFANLSDDAWITRREIAARLGYASIRSAERALAARGFALPKAMLGRGLVRVAVVKAWARRLDTAEASGAAAPHAGGPSANAMGLGAAASSSRGPSVVEAAELFARIRTI